jgi:predicted flap endonuclease-1-like 5' DNA nuclease
MGNPQRKYKLNPDWPSYPSAGVNGVNFDAETVVEGAQWEKYTRPMFENTPPQLVQTDNDTEVTKPALGTPAARQAQRDKPKAAPSGPSGILTTAVMQMEAEKEANEPPPAPAPEPEKPSGTTSLSMKPKTEAPKPPVKVLKPEHEKRAEKRQLEEAAANFDLVDIRGVKDGRAKQLSEAGFEKVEQVADADPQDLLSLLKSKGARMNLATAKSIVKSAKELLK